MITDSQRKRFFALAQLLSLARCRELLEIVTKGITSLRDPNLTPWKMSCVLSEIEKEVPHE
jgi:hypothetical protein